MERPILKIKTDDGLGNLNPSFKGIEITEFTFKPTRMGIPELTATLMWPTCLDDEWTHREYVELYGEKYYIRQTQTSEKTNSDVRYKHTLEFESERNQLARVYFYDVVPSWSATYDKPNTNSTKFTFYGTIREYADRLNCAFRYAGIGDSILKSKTTLSDLDTPVGDGYCVIVSGYGDGDVEQSQELSFEDQRLWDALVEGFNKYNIPFAFHGKKIVFNEYIEPIEHIFKYGYDNALLSVKKANADALMINRITFKGSEENIPYYYPNETEYGSVSVKKLVGNAVLTNDSFEVVDANKLVTLVPANVPVQLDVNRQITEFDPKSFEYKIGNSYANVALGAWIEVYEGGVSSPVYSTIFRAKFTTRYEGYAVIEAIYGKSWVSNNSQTFGSKMPSDDDYTNIVFSNRFNVNSIKDTKGKKYTDYVISDNGLVIGGIPADTEFTLEFTMTWRGAVATIEGQRQRVYWRISGIKSRNETDAEYSWVVDNKRYNNIKKLGVELTVPLSEDLAGEGFFWDSLNRMPTQDNLMPPKYRETGGKERFYNALNNTYQDENGNYIEFKNPYEIGNPIEYIYSDETIKPTIEGVTNSSGELFGTIAGIAFDSDDNDSIKLATGEDEERSEIDAANYEHSFFYIKLRKFDGVDGFNLLKCASQTDAMTIQMTSGKCNGCKFKIQVSVVEKDGVEDWYNPVQVDGNGDIMPGLQSDKINADNIQDVQQDTSKNSIWIAVQKDASTFGVIMPNRSNNYLPEVGDTFNFINIDLPQGYIDAAERRGELAMLKFMAENNEEKFNFEISASRIFFAHNPNILAQLDENSIIKIGYNNREYEQYVESIDVQWKDNEVLPEIKISLANTLTPSGNFVEDIVAKASSSNGVLSVSKGAGNGLSTALLDARYIRKDKSDRSPHTIASDTSIEVGNFVSGSSGAIIYNNKETGHSTAEVDYLIVRMKAIFEMLEIAHVQSIGGKMIVSPGGSLEISFVQELTSSYRCFFKHQEESEGADCRFIVGDNVICESFNVSNGLNYQASNQYYWRRVIAVNNKEAYFELSKDLCAEKSDAPKAGDTVCQLGSIDETRQSAIILSTIGSNAPCITLYDGIDNFTLSGKEMVDMGVDPKTNKAYFNVYGNAYIGDKNANSFLKYNNALKELELKAKLSIGSTIGDKSIDDYIQSVVPPVSQEDIEGFVNAIVDPKIENLQEQIDGVVETWFSNGVPTLDNYPASEWNNDVAKQNHLGDLYYDNSTGIAYRFSQQDGTYFWNVITDDAITKALAAAQEAKDIADSKRRIFTSEPYPPYDVGDLWVNATYPQNDTPTYVNELLRCFTPKSESESFSIADWDKACKYTDDSKLNDFIISYKDDVELIKTQIDGKAETWYQDTDPSLNWTTEELKQSHAGDLWYNTTDGTTMYWDGSVWKLQDIPKSVFDTIDGKSSIYVSKPVEGYNRYDLWFLEQDYTLSGVFYEAGTLVVAKQDMGESWSANDWIKKDRYTDDTLAQQAKDIAEAAQQAADAAQQDADAAKSRLDAWAADGVISPTEKQGLKDEIARIDGDYNHIVTEYNRYALGNPTVYIQKHKAYRDNLVILSATSTENIPIPDNFATSQTEYYQQRTAALTNIATAAKKYAQSVAEEEAAKAVAGLEYLKEALNATTTIEGGLILTSHIRLNDASGDMLTWSGINGVYKDGRTIAAWYGGDMMDLFDANDNKVQLTDADRPATSVIRMDGSAYFANGNIGFKADGGGWLGNKVNGITFANDGTMTFGSGILINVSNITGLQASLESLYNFNQGLRHIIVPCDINGNEITWEVASQTDSINGGFKAKSVKIVGGLWAEGYVSSHGYNPSGGSGGSGGGSSSYDRLDNWDDYTSDKAGYVLSAALGYDLYIRLSILEDKNYLDELSVSITGSGNAITSLSLSSDKKTLTATKGASFLTSITKADIESALTGTITSHTHNFSALANKPTTISGYGITAASVLSTLLNVDGAGSGLDADKLDGYDSSVFFRSFWVENPGYDCDSFNENSFCSFTYANNAPFTGAFADITINGYGFYLGTTYHADQPLYYRRHGRSGDGGLGEWQQIARVTDNVASATKLETSRTLWGRSFDGTADVVGALQDVTSILFSTTTTTHQIGTSSYPASLIHSTSIRGTSANGLTLGVTGNTNSLYIAPNGYIGIANNSPAERLHVNGAIYATTGVYSDGYVSARGQNTASDENLKENILPLRLSVSDIAKAPSISFDWKDTKKRDAGSIAQYWERVCPLTVNKTRQGYLAIDYGKAGLLSAISIAKELIDVEDRVKKLEQENVLLRQQIKKLKHI